MTVEVKKMNLPYTGVMTFGKLPLWETGTKADAVFLGAPYDLGSLNRPGARYAPRALRDAYTRSKPFFQIEFDQLYLAGLTMADGGDVDMPYPHAEACLANVEDSVSEVLASGAICGLFGGDRSVEVPAVKAHLAKGPLFIVNLGAHLDFDDDAGTVSEGTASRRLAELQGVTGMAHVGIRGPVPQAEALAVREAGHSVWTARKVTSAGAKACVESIPVGADCYVAIDCSVFDPGVFTGSTRPAPGGLSYVDVSDLLRTLARERRVRGFDVSGYAPLWDREAVSAQMAGRLALDFVNAILA